MTDAISVKDIRRQHEALHADFRKAQTAMQEAQGHYAKKKAVYCKFNDKYGRVLRMMDEDVKNGPST